MPNHFSLRVDGHLSKVTAWVDKMMMGGFAVRECVADNEHWHLYLIGDKTIKQLRCAFNRDVPELKGNGAYSLTECRDADKYIRYMCKGEGEGQLPEVVWRNSLDFTDDSVSEWHDQYWAENRALRKRKAGSMIDWVVDEAKRSSVSWSNRQALAKIYIKELGVRGKPINIHSVRANINAVQYALCPNDDALEDLANRVVEY